MTNRLTCTMLMLALGWTAACVSGDDEDGGTQSSSGSHWLSCDNDDDCVVVAGSCSASGVCVDRVGAPISVADDMEPGSEPGDPGERPAGAGVGGGDASGGGGVGGTAGGSSGAGGMSGGSEYDPCAGRACGEACTQCDPADPNCVETEEVKACDQDGTCHGGPVSCGPTDSGVVYPSCGTDQTSGGSCAGRDDQPTPECCLGDGTFLRCSYEVCTNSIPGNCSGSWQPVPGSDACGGYQPCAGKSCGDSCAVCDPADPNCVETADVKACDPSGECVSAGGVECPQPQSCELSGANTCGAGQVCCALGRCGPVVQDEGVCEAADPATGQCEPCECASRPGGCPVCNSPDTPILTPSGEVPIAELREGDLVLSMHGGEVVAVPVLATRQHRVFDHAVVRIELDEGGRIEVSGSHPTADGRRLDSLVPGDALGERTVVAIELVPYEHDRTYDILPASDSGTYFASGALLGSTLRAY